MNWIINPSATLVPFGKRDNIWADFEVSDEMVI